MNLNNKHQKIYLRDFLPYDIRVNLEKKFRIYLFDTAIRKAGTSAKYLADKLGYKKNAINCWRRGATRPRFKDLVKIVNYLDLDIGKIWNKIINFGSKGSIGYFKLPHYFIFDKKLAWFFGYRDGDGSRINPIIGSSSSPKEIDLLLRYKNTFDNLVKTNNKWSAYLYFIKPSLVKKIKEKFIGSGVINYSDHKGNDGFINIQIGASRVNGLFNNIEKKLDFFLKHSSREVQSSYAKGFFDSDGHVDIHGGVVLRQSIKGIKRIQRLQIALDNLNLNYKVKMNPSEITVIVYSLIDFKERIGFSSEIKKIQLSKIIECYQTKYDPTNIEKRIYLLCNSPITKKELMIKLKVKYGIISKLLNRMISNGKLKVVKRKPLTVERINEKRKQGCFNDEEGF